MRRVVCGWFVLRFSCDAAFFALPKEHPPTVHFFLFSFCFAFFVFEISSDYGEY